MYIYIYTHIQTRVYTYIKMYTRTEESDSSLKSQQRLLSCTPATSRSTYANTECRMVTHTHAHTHTITQVKVKVQSTANTALVHKC